MSHQIQGGDVVRLKSGGPKMTVSKLFEWQGRMEARCDWFEGTKATYGSFPLTSLELVEEAAESPVTSGLSGGGPDSWMR